MSQVALAIGELEKALPTSRTVTELDKWAVKNKGQKERKAEAEDAQEERLDQDIEHRTEYLAQTVLDSFEAAKLARTSAGIDDQIKLGRRLLNSQYTGEELATIAAGDGIDTWYDLALPLRNIAVAFMRSVLVSDEDNPLWSLSPTPIPNLPEDLIQREAEFLALELEQEISTAAPLFDENGVELTPITAEQIEERIDEWRENLYQKVDALAERQTRNLERKVKDTLDVTNFDKLLDDFVNDLATDPIAVVYGPVISFKKQPEWKNGRKVWRDRQFLEAKVVDVDRVWPSEDGENPQDVTWMFYLDRHTKTDLFKAKNMKGFVKENIEILLKDFQNGCRDWLNPIEEEMERLEDRPSYASWRAEEQIDVLKAHGDVQGEDLIKGGITKYCGKKIDPDTCYGYEFWIVDKYVLRICEQVYEGGKPFFKASMYPTTGSFYGRGIPHMVKDIQRKANMVDRAEVRDVSYTSGPTFETDIALLDPSGSVPDEIIPGLNMKKNSKLNPRGGKILEVNQIQSQAQYFNQLKERYFGEAELVTGINRQLLGQAQPGVSTLGESQLLQQNAATGLRSILQNIDQNFIEPFIEMVSCLIMMTTDDPSLKADAQTRAYGATNLLTRELNKNSLLQLFNTLLPAFTSGQPGVIEPAGMIRLIREIVKGFGQNPDDFLPDPLSVKYRDQERQQAINAANGGGVPGGSAQAPATQSVQAGISPASIGNAAI